MVAARVVVVAKIDGACVVVDRIDGACVVVDPTGVAIAVVVGEAVVDVLAAAATLAAR